MDRKGTAFIIYSDTDILPFYYHAKSPKKISTWLYNLTGFFICTLANIKMIIIVVPLF